MGKEGERGERGRGESVSRGGEWIGLIREAGWFGRTAPAPALARR